MAISGGKRCDEDGGVGKELNKVSCLESQRIFLKQSKAISNWYFRKFTHSDKSMEAGLEGSKTGGQKSVNHDPGT